MAIRIYTKTGDAGQTGLFGGRRVDKDDLRVEAYGTVDELNAVLGQARAVELERSLATIVSDLQAQLFELGAQLGTPPDAKRQPGGIRESDVTAMEQHIDRMNGELPEQKSFILPAGTPAAAVLHLARTVCRRAERRCVSLRSSEPETSPLVVRYLNRLSDLLFVMARYANHVAGAQEVEWHARETP